MGRSKKRVVNRVEHAIEQGVERAVLGFLDSLFGEKQPGKQLGGTIQDDLLFCAVCNEQLATAEAACACTRGKR